MSRYNFCYFLSQTFSFAYIRHAQDNESNDILGRKIRVYLLPPKESVNCVVVTNVVIESLKSVTLTTLRATRGFPNPVYYIIYLFVIVDICSAYIDNIYTI